MSRQKNNNNLTISLASAAISYDAPAALTNRFNQTEYLTSDRALQAAYIDTPIGTMFAIADTHGLYALEFIDQSILSSTAERLMKKLKVTIELTENAVIQKIKKELKRYFSGECLSFTTPTHFTGTPFQNSVWEQLTRIKAGDTASYVDMAKALNKPTAFRAVAQANGANPLPIIIPCHRVIYANGTLGGYSSGVAKKEWLLAHEKRYMHANDHR